jgi:hypothetical protein
MPSFLARDGLSTQFTIESPGIARVQVLKYLLQSLLGPLDGGKMILTGHQNRRESQSRVSQRTRLASPERQTDLHSQKAHRRHACLAEKWYGLSWRGRIGETGALAESVMTAGVKSKVASLHAPAG